MEDHDLTPSLVESPPSFQRALTAGAAAGVTVDFILFPLDTIKTRIQSAQGFVKSGGFKGVYSGVGSVGLGSAPGAATFFVTYEKLKEAIPKLVPLCSTSPGFNHLLSASGAEFASCLIRVPTEVVKSRTQAGTYGHGRSSIHSALMTARHEGIRGFYRGFGITIAREIPFTSIQFPLYEGLKTQLAKTYLNGERPSPGQAAICGMVAGGTAAVLTTPLDVVKTRVMLEAQASTAGVPLEKQPSPSVLSFYPRLMTIWGQEGAKALFSGWQPRMLAISFGGAVFLGIYDFFVHWGKPRTKVAEIK